MHWNFNENKVFLDFSNSDHELISQKRKLFASLIKNNVNAIPVIHANSPKNYKSFVDNLIGSLEVDGLAIRFSNENGGFINIDQTVAQLLQNLSNINFEKYLILDFGYVESHNVNVISALAISTIKTLSNPDMFKRIIIASSSFLNNLSSLTPAGKIYRLPRLEWNIWNQVRHNTSLLNLGYSDYGTKHPTYSITPYSGTCSIKYSTEQEYVIYRGELSKNHHLGNGQYIEFSKKLVNSRDYAGEHFSWGDAQINFYANQNSMSPKRKTGNPETWVSISQNHHVTLLSSLL